MNAERLHNVLRQLDSEIRTREVAAKFQALVKALKQYVGAPQEVSFQTALASTKKDCLEALSNSPSDSLSPVYRQVIEEMGVADLIGDRLRTRIQQAFDSNQMTPAVLQTELQQLHTQHNEFRASVEGAISAFNKLKVGAEQLAPGDCEIGLLLPRAEVESLLEFSAELKKFNAILKTFSEVADGDHADFKIRTISSSELLVFLDATMAHAACLAVAVERIVALYKQVLEIRLLRSQLKKAGVPEEKMKDIEAHAKSRIKDGIDEIAKDILEKYYKGEAARKNELTKAVKVALTDLAARIDRGYNVEVRVEPLSDADAKNTPDVREHTASITKALRGMQYLKLEGDPFLQLGEPEEDEPKKAKG